MATKLSFSDFLAGKPPEAPTPPAPRPRVARKPSVSLEALRQSLGFAPIPSELTEPPKPKWIRSHTVEVWMIYSFSCGHTACVPANEHLFVRWRRASGGCGDLIFDQATPAGLINPDLPRIQRLLTVVHDGPCAVCSAERLICGKTQRELEIPTPTSEGE